MCKGKYLLNTANISLINNKANIGQFMKFYRDVGKICQKF